MKELENGYFDFVLGGPYEGLRPGNTTGPPAGVGACPLPPSRLRPGRLASLATDASTC